MPPLLDQIRIGSSLDQQLTRDRVVKTVGWALHIGEPQQDARLLGQEIRAEPPSYGRYLAQLHECRLPVRALWMPPSGMASGSTGEVGEDQGVGVEVVAGHSSTIERQFEGGRIRAREPTPS